MNATPSKKSVLKVLSGETLARPPLWMMRQAGRYLPEYRRIRAQAGSFLSLCYNPELAAEVTLQPIRRFGFDAAILFSDILVVPHALGQDLRFEEGEGPKLSPILDANAIDRLPNLDMGILDPVISTVRLVKSRLDADTTFIGFCGAPWTVASYMIAGRGTRDLEPVRRFAYAFPDAFEILINKLADVSVDYLCAQAEAGVEVVQIFDSWAGLLPPDEFVKWCVRPVQRMVEALRQRAPATKIITFPREAGGKIRSFLNSVRPDGLGIGSADDVPTIRSMTNGPLALQGQIDPIALLVGGDALEAAVRRNFEAFDGAPAIFNLGHGILPTTPLAHVEQLVELVRR